MSNPRPARTGKNLRQPTAAETAATEAREIRVLELLADNYSLDEAAKLAGYSDRSGAWRAAQRGLARRREPAADALRATWNARYEMMHLALWPKVEAGDDKAQDRWIRLAADVFRNNGLIRPATQHVTHEFAVPETPEERRAQIIALTGQVQRAASELTTQADSDDAASG